MSTQKSELNQNKNLYIHIPFCKSKCFYCGFISFAEKNDFIEPYFEALKKELASYSDKAYYSALQTIYIGGGTPSLADIKLYTDLFEFLHKKFKIAENAEITMEINPATVDFEYLKSLKSLGVNRLSIGVQTFQDNILKILNRRHNSQDAFKTVEIARKAGFENISIDLMYGLPEESLECWEETLKKAIDLNIEHISTYGLKIEENTEFFKNPPKNLPDDELQSIVYLKTIEILQENGFCHYEVSNFSKKSFESKHNLCYWQNRPYFGIGLSAHGYIDGIRYANTESLTDYIKNPLERFAENKISQKEQLEEAVFLGLRMRSGICRENFIEFYEVDIFEKYSAVIKKYTELGFLSVEGSVLRLTNQGILLSNSVLSEFLE
jgi:oxygen-independent coproporphyrinogen-3 oxidase